MPQTSMLHVRVDDILFYAAAAKHANFGLTVSDAVTATAGKLVNADYALPSTLQARALSAKGTGSAFAPVRGTANPTPLLNYTGAVNDSAVTLEFQQHIGVNDALRAGKYSKTLTFTLSTTTP